MRVVDSHGAGANQDSGRQGVRVSDEVIESVLLHVVSRLEEQFPSVFSDTLVADAAINQFPGLDEAPDHALLILAGFKAASLVDAIPPGYIDPAIKLGLVLRGEVLYLPDAVEATVRAHPDVFPGGPDEAFALLHSGNTSTNHRQTGLLLGFPRPATDWFQRLISDQEATKMKDFLGAWNFDEGLPRRLDELWKDNTISGDARAAWVENLMAGYRRLELPAEQEARWREIAERSASHTRFGVDAMTWADRFDSAESRALEAQLELFYERYNGIQQKLWKQQ